MVILQPNVVGTLATVAYNSAPNMRMNNESLSKPAIGKIPNSLSQPLPSNDDFLADWNQDTALERDDWLSFE